MPLVVVLWRPDTTTGWGPPATPAHHHHLNWIGGQWASDQRVYTRDELPRSYAGQEGYPQLPFFAQLSDAARYLTASRDHTACQLDVDEFRRQFPEVKLSP